MARFRLRGLEKVNIEGVLKAAGQNIKQLLNYNNWWNPKHPAGGALLSPCIFLFDPLLHATPTTGLLLAKDFFNTLGLMCDTADMEVERWCCKASLNLV
jgi:hypothetical protein